MQKSLRADVGGDQGGDQGGDRELMQGEIRAEVARRLIQNCVRPESREVS